MHVCDDCVLVFNWRVTTSAMYKLARATQLVTLIQPATLNYFHFNKHIKPNSASIYLFNLCGRDRGLHIFFNFHLC